MPHSSAGNGSGWQVVDEESYERAVAQCGSFPYLDEILAPVDYALHRNPTGFPVVPGYANLYLAKTKLRFIRSEVIPSFKLWFRANNDNRMVHKLYIEITPPEEIPYGESFWDEDLPF